MTLTIETKSIYALLFGLLILLFGIQQRQRKPITASAPAKPQPKPAAAPTSSAWPNGQRIEREDQPAAKSNHFNARKTAAEHIADLDAEVVGAAQTAFTGAAKGFPHGHN